MNRSLKKAMLNKLEDGKGILNFYIFQRALRRAHMRSQLRLKTQKQIEEVVVTMDRIETFKKIDKYPKNQLEQ